MKNTGVIKYMYPEEKSPFPFRGYQYWSKISCYKLMKKHIGLQYLTTESCTEGLLKNKGFNIILTIIMVGFLIRILGNSVAIYVAYLWVPGFSIAGGIKEFLLAGVLLGLLNRIVRPPIKLISMPLIILTLGLFLVVINALMLWLVDYTFDFVTIGNITALVWATIIVTLVNAVIGVFSKIID
jgi:putative membrane protein